MMSKYFGTDGFRGEANVTLTVDHAFRVGRFWYYSQDHQAQIVIGKDTRRSSYMFECALAAGITASGADACLMHVTTTPSVSYISKVDEFDCGIMISASHNPFHDNGIKLINRHGEKMEQEVIDQIEAYLDSARELPYATGEHIGRVIDYASGRNRYIGYLISLATHSYKDMKVALDCANGSAWMIAKNVFEALGAETYVLSNTPNGLNINDGCGSTHIEQLQQYVKENHMDIGFAFDGDADRCLAVDEKGREIDGDKIIAILAKDLKDAGKLPEDTAVVTVMSNLGFIEYMKQNGMKTAVTAVGDRYVLEEMRDKGYVIGGEQSGHVILLAHSTTGDGELTAGMLLRTMAEKKCRMSELNDVYVRFPQVMVNIKATPEDKARYKEDEYIAGFIESQQQSLMGLGRVLVRVSGTEPLIRIMVEGKDEAAIAASAERIAVKINERIH